MAFALQSDSIGTMDDPAWLFCIQGPCSFTFTNKDLKNLHFEPFSFKTISANNSETRMSLIMGNGHLFIRIYFEAGHEFQSKYKMSRDDMNSLFDCFKEAQRICSIHLK